MIDAELSPKARAARLAEVARVEIERARDINRQTLGVDADFEVYVDGRQGAPVDSVKPGGFVFAEWDLLSSVLEFIGKSLLEASPYLTGRYQNSFVMFVDGVEHEPGATVPDAEEIIFANVTPYSRKIERGLSAQSPSGVLQVVAAIASRRFGNIASVKFSYRSIQETGLVSYGAARKGGRDAIRQERETRLPAIIVRPF